MLGKRNFYRKSLTLGSVSIFALSFGLTAAGANEAGTESAAAITSDTVVISARKGTETAGKVAKTEKKAPKVANNSTRYQIAAQPLAEALLQFSTQTDVMVIAAPDLLQGKSAPQVVGPMSSDDALKSLLKDSGLDFQKGERGEIIIRRSEAGKISSANAGDTGRDLALANTSGRSAQNSQNSQNNQTGNNATAEQDNEPFLGPLTKEELEEIVVTGSLNRGVRSASPVFVYGRKDIDQTGVSTLPEFIQTLPQNFGGGISEIGGAGNVNRGNGVNLRGLGNDSTLVLLNGRRLAPAGTGNFVDISMIPFSAIERVDVLTDGASAIYGSDAVGGVVNFILRDDYEGAETRVRYGTATSGDLDDIQVGQNYGASWDSGHALISYEYQNRDSLDANDRSFSEDEPDPTDLLPNQERNSFFLSGGQNLNDTIEIFGDAFYSKRKTNFRRVRTFGSTVEAVLQKTEQYGGGLGVQAALGSDWQMELVGSFSHNNVSGNVKPVAGEVRAATDFTSANRSLEGKVDGTLFVLPGGDVKLAVGGQVRRETFEEVRSTALVPEIDAARTIYAAFGEMFVPLVGENNRRAGLERLELTVAGRYEDYSDFGSSTDSKLGLLWSPVEGLNLRGTYGTSFRAPLFRELAGAISGIFVPLPDSSSPDGSSLTVFAQGANPDLQPESATTWTAGFDIAPTSLRGLNIQATYFDINFEDRIATSAAGFDALTNPSFAFLVNRNPSPELLAFFEAQPDSLNFAGVPFTEAEALFEGFLRNLSSVQTRGLDVSLSYTLDSDAGSFTLNLASTYLLEQSQQILPTDSPVDLVGTVGNPPDLKLRASINWASGGFSTNLAVNHIDGFRNVQFEPVEDVSSWTTVDFNINYRTGGSSGSAWLDNTVFSISALNLFDQDPPFVTDTFGNANFDIANASPVGRAIAFQITKQW